eukprot:355089-Chlamydomonas_euryale.AAC.6
MVMKTTMLWLLLLRLLSMMVSADGGDDDDAVAAAAAATTAVTCAALFLCCLGDSSHRPAGDSLQGQGWGYDEQTPLGYACVGPTPGYARVGTHTRVAATACKTRPLLAVKVRTINLGRPTSVAVCVVGADASAALVLLSGRLGRFGASVLRSSYERPENVALLGCGWDAAGKCRMKSSDPILGFRVVKISGLEIYIRRPMCSLRILAASQPRPRMHGRLTRNSASRGSSLSLPLANTQT